MTANTCVFQPPPPPPHPPAPTLSPSSLSSADCPVRRRQPSFLGTHALPDPHTVRVFDRASVAWLFVLHCKPIPFSLLARTQSINTDIQMPAKAWLRSHDQLGIKRSAVVNTKVSRECIWTGGGHSSERVQARSRGGR